MTELSPALDPEGAVRDGAIATFRQLLPIVAPNICGYEMRALPGLVIEGATRLRDSRDYLKELCDRRRESAADAEDQSAAMRGVLEALHDELFNFAAYSRSVAEECVGQRRLMWQERAEWADKLAGQAKKAARV